jgi:hypothetical protein
MSVKALQEQLVIRQQEIQNMETFMRTQHGSSVLARNYPNKMADGGKPKNWYPGGGNLKNLKKDYARIKTFLNQKLRPQY